ncbi:MAG: hypothetical protein ACREKE_04840, partial [bacterium]
VKTLALAALLVSGAAAAHADLLEVSGFGGFSTLDMTQVNNSLTDFKTTPGVTETKDKGISQGFLVGLNVKTGSLIPLPFFEVGFKGEYIGADAPGEIAGMESGQPYDIKETPSLTAGMIGLDFHIGIPATPLKVGLSVYGGYGEGLVQESMTVASAPTVTDLYDGGGFVGEAEARVDCHLYSVLSLYVFGGYRIASFGTFADGANQKFSLSGSSAPDLNFSGTTGGGGLNFDF